jgi:hypothetical protein
MIGIGVHFWQWLIIGVKLIDHPSQASPYELFRLAVFALFTATLLWRLGRAVKSWISKRSGSSF